MSKILFVESNRLQQFHHSMRKQKAKILFVGQSKIANDDPIFEDSAGNANRSLYFQATQKI